MPPEPSAVPALLPGFSLAEPLAAFWHVSARMAPWLLFGFLVAGLLHVFLGRRFVARRLGGRGWRPLLASTLFGLPLPLCSCGVIPVAASLRRSGASRGAVAAFLLTTPQTGADSIAVTWSLLGPVVTAFRVATALVSGLLSGALVNLGAGREDPGPSPDAEHEDGCRSCHHEPAARGPAARALIHAFVSLPRDLAPSLLVGIALAGLLGALLPPDAFGALFGSGPAGRAAMMGAMLLLGIPLYVCATSSVPLAGALVAAGVSPGAALVFLMTGPASNAAGIATALRLFGGRATALYLAALAGVSLAAGVLLDLLFPSLSFPLTSRGAEALAWWHHAGAAVLLALLAAALVLRRLGPRAHACADGDARG